MNLHSLNSSGTTNTEEMSADLIHSLLSPSTLLSGPRISSNTSIFDYRGKQHTNAFTVMSIPSTLLILICLAVVSRSKNVRTKLEQWRKWAASRFQTTSSLEEIKEQRKDSQYTLPPLKPKTSSRTTMGLKRLDASNWLTIDPHLYSSEHYARLHLLESDCPSVIQCLPGSEAACHEVLSLAVEFLTTRFPHHFTLKDDVIYNHIVNESFFVGPECSNPMEVAARLAMEDFNILVKNSETGEYHLQASATLFPAGWKLQERIGTTMANLHAPVPGWKEKLGGSVNRYFDHLSPKTAMERHNLFVQTTPDLFTDAPEASSQVEAKVKPQDLQVRRERQTFTRLEKTGAVLFTVRTYMQPLAELEEEEAMGFMQQVRSWSDEIKVYKGGDVWGEAFDEWCEKRFK